MASKTLGGMKALTRLEAVGARHMYSAAFSWAPDGVDVYWLPGESYIAFRRIAKHGVHKSARVTTKDAILVGRYTRDFGSVAFVRDLDDFLLSLREET